MELFTDSKEIELKMIDADVTYFPEFLNYQEADGLFNALLEDTPWQQDDITVFGKTYKQPRLTALYASNAKGYSYSNITMKPHNFSKKLLSIKSRIEDKVHEEFTTCLLNLYRDGADSNGWHADDEKELGVNPIIASVSLGVERVFHFKHKDHKALKERLILKHGSLLLMKGPTQHNWLHQIPKTKKPIGKRINLTFRMIE